MSTPAEQRDVSGGASHELVDHTSEVTVRLRAPDFAELLAEATRAFVGMVPDALRGAADVGWRDIQLRAADAPAQLVEWLNEMVYFCEAELWLPTEVEVVPDGDAGLRVRARGIELDAPFVLVKAATLHNATVREGRDGLEGEVTLDI